MGIVPSNSVHPQNSGTLSVPVAARQLMLVVAPTWDAQIGQLQRFERLAGASQWQPVGAAIAVSLGRAGLAWGRGLHVCPDGAQKQEGDGCTPAGIFAVTALFGVAAPDGTFARAARLPYLSATDDLKAVDDPASAYYNQIVDQTKVTPDWSSCEDMLRRDARYELGAVVGHNSAPSLPGAGSCIFLHVREIPGAPTAGCTAMSLADMREVADWLDGAAEPVLVQLPLAEYTAWRISWGLPDMASVALADDSRQSAG